jgi:uncharacterized membrane protein
VSRHLDLKGSHPGDQPPASQALGARRLPLLSPALQKRIAWGAVWILIVIFALVVGYHALYRHWEYHSDAFDLGNMDQAVWNTLHGHPFRFTNRGNDDFGPPTRLSIHVEPIIFALALLYLIHSGPETLLVTQTLALALGAIPLFALSLRRLPQAPFVGVALVFAYLICPLTLGIALWEFHPVALATPLLIAAVWALDARRYRWFLLFALLAMTTKEEIGLSVAIMAFLLAAFRPERRRFGVMVGLVALAWVAICFKVIMPHFNVGVAGGNNYWYRYAWLGATPTEALVNLIIRPWIALGYLADPGRLGYLSVLARTAGGLGLLAPVSLLPMLPDLAVNTLSSHAEQYSGFFQYNAAIVPYLMVAAVYGVAALYRARLGAASNTTERGVSGSSRPAGQDEDLRASPHLWGRLVVMGRRLRAWWLRLLGSIPVPARWLQPVIIMWIVGFSLWNVFTVSRIAPIWAAGDPPSAALVAQMRATDALLARIPGDASVCATDTLNPHVSDRLTVYLMPDPQCYQADYVAADLPSAVAEVRAADTVMLQRMRASSSYEVVGEAGGVVLLRRIGAPLSGA